MFSFPHSKEGEGPRAEALIARLRVFVEDSDLSFYRIASRVGTTGTTLSMWLARTAKPNTAELAAIERLLGR
jgi:DNA transposition AAA+ family ATPase